MTQLMQYRFPAGSGLDNHAFGNLFIAAMTAVTGDFEEAVRESNRVLAVRGQVLPATSVPLNLSARLAVRPARSTARSAITTAGEPIERVFIEPADVRANREALERILEADMIVIGPGSLFTSVLPNLLISRHPRRARGGAGPPRLRLQRGDPARRDRRDMTASEHLARAVRPRRRRPHRLRHRQPQHRRAPSGGLAGQPVEVDVRRLEELPVVIVEEDVVDPANAHRHDPAKLAAALMRLQQEDRVERPRQRRDRAPDRPRLLTAAACSSPAR